MARHFEEIWNESEEISLSAFVNEDVERVAAETAAMLGCLSDLDKSERADELGEILFRLCWLTNKYRLNSYLSLRSKLNDYKVDVYEPDVTSE